MNDRERADELAAEAMLPTEAEALEALPLELAEMEMPMLLISGRIAAAVHDEMLALGEQWTGDPASLAPRLFAKELEFRRRCHLIADELERRRTGIAPRARKMN